MQKYLLPFLFVLGINYIALSQCYTGGEPSCTCMGAPVLCSINDLNGYSYSMSTNEPAGNNSPPLGNTQICSIGGTQINNPTWFSFIAWCTNLTLIAHVSNCIDNPNRPGISIGIQAAVFASCTQNSCIASSVTGCGTNPFDRTLNLSGLTVGGRYYFLVDGCAGSACDISIEVVGDCSLTVGDIEPVQGPERVCGTATGTFTIPAVQGAALYHWTLNGTPIGGTTRTVTTSFPGPGIYTLCVDVSNPPCLMQSDDPTPKCTQVEVLGEAAEAGMLTVVTSPSCPGTTINFSVAGFNTNTNLFTQKLLITNASGTILEILDGTSGSYTSNVCGTFRVYSYNYSPAPSSIQPALGLNANTLICTNCFCDIEFVTLVFADTQPPVFTSPPSSVSVTCFEDIPPPENLDWTDNCAPPGVAVPAITSNYTPCQGGTITRTWTVTDLCNNTSSYTQTITISPIPAATFTPYPDVSIQCSEINTFDYTKELLYDNGRTGSCAIMGSITPVRNDNNYVNCQGTIRLTWNAVDQCNRPIFDEQIITVNPPPVANYSDVPTYAPIPCEDASSFFPPALDYTNNSVDCPITGSVNPLLTPSYNSCGGSINITWNTIDNCQRPINVTRSISILPADAPQITDVLPQNVTIECGPVEGFNVALNYSNGSISPCLISGTLNPSLTQNFNACGGSAQVSWSANANCGFNPNHIQNITVLPAPVAEFQNVPPSVVTYSCAQVPSSPPPLQYSNGLTGTCGINGTVPATVSGSYNRCGGTLTYTWSYTDACGRNITYMQDVIVEPAPDAFFANPPVPLVQLPCNTNYPNPPSLIYSNSLTGPCAINGTVIPTFVDFGDHREYTWTFQNPCSGVVETVTQEVYLSPNPTIDISPMEGEICLGDYFDLSDIILTLGGGTSFDIKYYTGTNPGPANELFSTLVNPAVTTSYTIRAFNEFGCFKDAVFMLKVIVNNQSGTGQSVSFCNSGDLTINFFQYLINVTDFNGEWLDELGSGVDISNPYSVRFLNMPDGVYRFIYTVPSPNQCPEIPATLIIRLVKSPSYRILRIECAPDLQSYSIQLLVSGFTVTSNRGTIVPGTNDTLNVINIPAGQNVTVNFKSQVNGCVDAVLPVTAPDCNCPFVPPPTSGGDKKVCFGDQNPELNVSLSAHQTSNWYDEETGGNLISSNDGKYTPVVTAVGNYIFYVESFDTITMCPSTIRIPIALEVIPLLNLQQDTFRLCDDNFDNQLNFPASDIKNAFYKKNNLSAFFKFEFYATLPDAEANINPILSPTIPVSGTGDVFIAVTNADNCRSISQIRLIILPKPKVDIAGVNHVVCIGESNGGITLRLAPGETVSFNNSNYSTLTSYSNLSAGNYKVRYINDTGCLDSTTVTVNDGLNIQFSAFDIRCNNNNTLLNKDDDYYELTARLTSTSALSTSYQLFYQNTLLGTFMYGENISVRINADGSSGDIQIVDVLTGCKATRPIGPLQSCSFPCSVVVSGLVTGDCNNNQTNDDPEDDTFLVSFSTSITGVTGNRCTVYVDGVTAGVFNYNTVISLTLKADGLAKRIEIVDEGKPECITIFNVQKAPCSKCEQTVDAGVAEIITCQKTTVTLSGTSSAPGIFLWKGPNDFEKTGITVTTNTPGTYYLYVSFPDRCIISDSVIVSRDANVPLANGGPDVKLDCYNPSAVLTGSTNISSGTILSWTNAAGTLLGSGNTITVTQSGTYYFEVINTLNNCSSGKDEVIVTEDKIIPSAVISADPGNLLDCVIGTITLSGLEVANVIYNWQTGESFINNQRVITVTKDGRVVMTAIDTLNGCQNSSSIEIIDLQDYPILVTQPAAPITCINNGTYISAGLSPSGQNLVFTWYGPGNVLIPGQNNDSLYVTSPGTYYVVLTDTINRCFNRDTVIVDRIGDFPEVKLPDDITLYCGVDKTAIQATIQNPLGQYNISWSNNGGAITSANNIPTVNIQGGGEYTVDVTYTISGCKTSESITVTKDENYPRALASQVQNETCSGQKDGSIVINTVNGGSPPYTYRFNGVASNSKTEYTPLSPGRYAIQISDANGCKYDTIINVEPGVVISLETLSPLELGYKQSRLIEVITNLSSDKIASVKWTPNDNLSCDTCLITSLLALEDKNYTVLVTDINGCTQSINITLRVRENIIITTPNIINPSGTSNKYFTVYGNESVINIEKLSIFDRWGNLVFTKSNFLPNNPQEGWNGTFNGREVTPGVYVFTVEYLAPSGKKILSGDLTVIK